MYRSEMGSAEHPMAGRQNRLPACLVRRCRSSKLVRSCNPRLGRFDSGAAPSLDSRKANHNRRALSMPLPGYVDRPFSYRCSGCTAVTAARTETNVARLTDGGGASAPQEPLGMLLVKRGLITDEQLAIALEDQRTSGEHLGTILLARGFATPASVAQALATQHGGLLKTEYGFATGFGTGVSQSGTVAEPPVSSATIGKPETEVAASTRPADLRAELETRLGHQSKRVAELEEELAGLRSEPTAARQGQDIAVWQAANIEAKQALAQWQAAYAEVEQVLVQWQAAYGELDQRLTQATEQVASLQAELAAAETRR